MYVYVNISVCLCLHVHISLYWLSLVVQQHCNNNFLLLREMRTTHMHIQSDLCDMYESCARCGLNCTEEEDCSPDSLDNSREYPTGFVYMYM